MFFRNYNSELVNYSEEFVYYADLYDLDWRLIPSITGVESTFAKNIPTNSYNAYGWANGEYKFTSWEDSISHVAKVLREKYVDKGNISVSDIARIYCPPSSTWAYKVNYFMDKIDPHPIEFTI